jgi:hypothetical protein
LKPLIREIVSSRTYRMATRHDAHAARLDPENRLLWRQHRRRLEPEEIRDTLLLIAGRLDRSPADALVAELPMKDLTGEDAFRWAVDDPRRTVYQPVIRTMEPDVLQLFDGPPSAMTTGQRAQTTVAPQALFFLNAPFVQDCARRYAQRLAAEREGIAVTRVVTAAFRGAIGRAPNARELALLSDYLATQFEGPPGPTVHDLAKLAQAIFGSTQFQVIE